MQKTLLYFLFLLNFTLYGQTSLQWQKSIGAQLEDVGSKILKTKDGGYIVLAYSSSTDGNMADNHGSYDIVVIKLNSAKTIEWQKSYGGSKLESGRSIIETKDGGYIIVGESYSADGDVSGHHGTTDYTDLWLLKIASDGQLEWQKSLGGSATDAGVGIVAVTDGYVIGGTVGSNDGDVKSSKYPPGSGNIDFWVVKVSISGNLIWEKSYGGKNGEECNSIAPTSDGGFILSGNTTSSDGDVTGYHDDFDYWVVKLNSLGEMEWQKTLGGKKFDNAVSAIQDSEGNYIVTGYTGSSDGDITNAKDGGDAWVVKLNSNGNIVWQKSLGGLGGDYLYSVVQTLDGGYVLAGDTSSNDGDATGHHGTEFNFDFWIIKLSNNGNVEWSKSLGGSNHDTASGIIETGNENYTVIGYSESNDGDLLTNNGKNDIWIVNLGNNLGVPEKTVSQSFSFYPNPTKDFINLNVDSNVIGSNYKIYDQYSKLLKTGKLESEHSIVQISDLPTGIYFLKILDSNLKIIKN
ncbi:T9SS type A sorting domain-containing protein [Flavobacterium branchiicola]|uniref:T9SS type A sorting domain-containing protein n=1 Tax=Flavobacterium branchiicola TaxID=1114875 RepID=A0ABV9P8K0_9FLAO|nr:T9SS type A sorting domain-containing protein [Flavobacterium branchiicola]MBS7252483.1 T9SS type A sorting domain-containing protein [Flavobacterium branchiicola]